MRARSSQIQRVVAAAAVLSLVPGCAQIVSRSSVEVVPRPDAPALMLGPNGGEITSRSTRAGWTQAGDRLAVRIEEARTCNSVRHVPVTRIERVDRRTAGGAMWIEYGVGAAAVATGLVGLIRPESFSQTTVIDADGNARQDTGTGYRIGGILTGIGVLLLTAAVVDTVRTRDEVRYADAYRREQGGVVECMDPLAPVQGQTVELLVGKWKTVEPTDDEGGARFLLPAVDDLPEDARKVIEATAAWDAAKAQAEANAARAAEERAARLAAEAAAAKTRRKGKPAAAGPAGVKAGAAAEAGGAAAAGAATSEPVLAVELGPRPEPVVVRGVLRLDDARALAVSFVVPYTADVAKGHAGQGIIDAETGAKAPPRGGKGNSPSLTAGSGDGADAGTRDAGDPAKRAGEDAGSPEAGREAKGAGKEAGTQRPAPSEAKDGATIRLGGPGRSP